MITSRNDRGDFIIATPTKCATTTLEATAKRHMRNAGIDADEFRIMDWDKPRRQHRMALPPAVRDEGAGEMEVVHEGEDISLGVPGDDNEWGAADRFLAVRNPFTRYASIYTYLSNPQNYSQWGAREIQGNAWGGHGDIVYDNDPMTFGEFLTWLARRREEVNEARCNRGLLTEGRAYRSPWVWTDSLDMSLMFLQHQPGEQQDEVSLLRMDPGWVEKSLLAVKQAYGLDGLQVGGLHSNRTTTYGAAGTPLGDASFWGGFRCTRRVFSQQRSRDGWTFDPDRLLSPCGSSCSACTIGVAYEAEVLGYLQ